MKFYGAGTIRFGFTGMYAYAGSEEDYFDRHAYLRVALAPVLLWGILFLILCFLVPSDWLGVAYFLQMINVGGAAGDLYVSVLFGRCRQPIWIRDTGVEMFVYAPDRT